MSKLEPDMKRFKTAASTPKFEANVTHLVSEVTNAVYPCMLLSQLQLP